MQHAGVFGVIGVSHNNIGKSQLLIGQAVHKRNHFAIVIGILNPAQILAAFRVIGPITFVKIEVEERRFFCRFTASRNSGIKEHAS